MMAEVSEGTEVLISHHPALTSSPVCFVLRLWSVFVITANSEVIVFQLRLDFLYSAAALF